MITYAIISPDRDAPWGYYATDKLPTLEELADHMAQAGGYENRDVWIAANSVGLLGFAPVH
ncbi:beta-lactoglobulin I [Burkholderia sp. Z1]|uniref:beta-lactoglobulin I n=1 Tax=Burkholderia sp. Z1 TaxID=2759039 RepID=UPI001867E168|nr:beta-lactoglobulin I [Burkholderia sp. Z1]